MQNTGSILDVKNLSVAFETPEGTVQAVNGVNLSVSPGECLGIVGESGSGKSQTFLAVFGLLADNAKTHGSVTFEGEEILNAPVTQLNRLRGDKMSMIFQDSITGLTPHMKVGQQMSEVLTEHRGLSQQDANKQALEIMEVVQIPQADRRFHMYPHEFSGGMRQRIMIAQALLCRPSLLVADEPTTALDVTVQASIISLFRKLKEHTQSSIVIITHDLGVIAGLSDRVAVMYGGRLVETAPVETIFERPCHPYTQGLIASMPRVDLDVTDELPTIPGQPPDLLRLPPGCVFSERCSYAMEKCRGPIPSMRGIGHKHDVACYREEFS